MKKIGIILILFFLVDIFVIGQSKPRSQFKPPRSESSSGSALTSFKRQYDPKKKKHGKKNPTRTKPTFSFNGKKLSLKPSLEDWYYGLNNFEVGGLLGVSTAFTDAGGTADQGKSALFDINPQATNLAFGGFIRYKISRFFVVYAGLTYAQLSGADSLAPKNTQRYARGFSFQNQLMELNIRPELNLQLIGKSESSVKFNVYLFPVSLGIFVHKPSLKMPSSVKPEDISLSNPDNYKNYQISIPIGGGAAFTLINNYKLGYEMGYRVTFTDYLDGFTRSSSKANDSYFFTTISLSYVFREGKRKGKSLF